jgi:sulfur carrier protein
MSDTLHVFINQQAAELPAGAHLVDAIQHANIQPPFAAAVNLQFVPKHQYALHALQNGDHIELISPITGG